MTKRAVLLANLGSPDAPETRAVRRYLNQFLMDRYVIQLPWLLRRLEENQDGLAAAAEERPLLRAEIARRVRGAVLGG